MGVLKNTFNQLYRFMSDTGSIMLKLTNISIALLSSAVFVNSKTVRSVSKDECAIACREFDGQLEYMCKNVLYKSEIIDSKCGAIDFEMGDDHVKNALKYYISQLEDFKNDMPSLRRFGDYSSEKLPRMCNCSFKKVKEIVPYCLCSNRYL